MTQLAMYVSPFLKSSPFRVQTGIAQIAFAPPPPPPCQTGTVATFLDPIFSLDALTLEART